MFGIASIAIGSIALVLTVNDYFSSLEEQLAYKLTLAIDVVSNCDLPSDEQDYSLKTFYQSEKELLVGNYSGAVDLYNSQSGTIMGCDQMLQVKQPYFMLWTVLVMMIIIGIMILAGKLSGKSDPERKE
ncbi:hypothetical protein IID20_01780 [Patescibacteria group bacterium]|nr:hypothetical protein [Patescibacteria group bacterium]